MASKLDVYNQLKRVTPHLKVVLVKRVMPIKKQHILQIDFLRNTKFARTMKAPIEIIGCGALTMGHNLIRDF